MSKKQTILPISERPLPADAAWLWENSYLLEAGASSPRTETTYRSGLRLLADWLQHYGRVGYDVEETWPLNPDRLSTAVILQFRNWLLANRSRSTANTYLAAVTGYLHYLDGQDQLPTAVQLGKLQRQLARRPAERNPAAGVIDLDHARQTIPRVVTYYDTLPLPLENDPYNRRLSLLRDRALVHVLYSTAARISEVVALNRSNVDDGYAKHAVIIGKGSKARTLYIQTYARRAIRAYLAERSDGNAALFIAHSRNAQGARLSITSVHKIIKKAVRALKLHGSLSAHDFRHFRATQLLREGMPLEVVQEFLGHTDVATTRNIYAPLLGVQVVGEWLDNLDVSPHEAAAEKQREV